MRFRDRRDAGRRLARELGALEGEHPVVLALPRGGVSVFNDRLLDDLGLVASDLAEVTRREILEVHRRAERYRGDRAAASVAGRTVVLVDDGVATGFTVRAAIEILRRHGAARIVVAVPVGARRAITELARLADQIVCLHAPNRFSGVGEFYDDFGQLSDPEVTAILGTVASRETPSDCGAAALDEKYLSRPLSREAPLRSDHRA